jgi:uncharacterized membrane protein YkvA (DUF1232 family)
MSRLRDFIHRLRIDAHAAWLAARDPRTPLAARIVGWMVAGYALSPIDLIPDFVPVLGLIDDLLIVPAGLWLFRRLIPDTMFADFLAQAEAESRRPTSLVGALFIGGLWLVAAALIAYNVWSWRFY